MKRFLLFAGLSYDAAGGWGDFVDSFNSIEDATTHVSNAGNTIHWWHLIDGTNGDRVRSSSF